MGNAWKVSKRIRRIRRKYLSVMENMAILGYLRYTKLSPNARKVFNTFGEYAERIGKNLCVYGEDAKRLLAYSPNMPRDIKVRISL
jgi:hypothetical protein